jgi:hypothetical protein
VPDLADSHRGPAIFHYLDRPMRGRDAGPRADRGTDLGTAGQISAPPAGGAR